MVLGCSPVFPGVCSILTKGFFTRNIIKHTVGGDRSKCLGELELPAFINTHFKDNLNLICPAVRDLFFLLLEVNVVLFTHISCTY